MEGLEQRTAFAETVGNRLRDESFTLIDVGCRDGIDVGWKTFGQHLLAYGFDPNIAECKRLSAIESNPNIHYLPAFVGISPDHPFALKKAGKPHFQRNPWERLSAARSLEVIAEQHNTLSIRERTNLNLWQATELADADKPVFLPTFFEESKLESVDFIKIDVDGADFEILASLDSTLGQRAVLGLGLEVNYVGSECETDHTFHNTDRFMRSHGFDLFGLTVRRYSNRRLPSKYLGQAPGPTEYGRPLQGDALYLRDLASGEACSMAAVLSTEKLAKLAAIFSLFQLPDCAAELLVCFRQRLGDIMDVDLGLDLLASQAQIDVGTPLPYRQYITAFEANHRSFYRGRLWPLSDAPRLLRKNWRRIIRRASQLRADGR